MARDRGRSFSPSLLVILLFLAALTGNVASSSCQQGWETCNFRQIATGRLPTMPADATFHHSNRVDCTRFCMELLGPRCNSLSHHRERQECRVYSNSYARLQMNQSAGYDFFDACQVMVNDACEKTEDCFVSNAECRAGSCQCLPRYHANLDTETCDATVVGDACSVTADCYPANSQCQAGTCRCASQRHYDSTSLSCTLTVVGDACNVTADCYPANSQCQAGTCRCLSPRHYFNTSLTCTLVPSCDAFKQQGQTTSGVYHLDLRDGGQPFQVYCDMDTDGGGWTVFQRRRDGSVDFFLNWAAYKTGFGTVTGEHWLGNDILHRLTAYGMTELRVDLKDWSDRTAFAHYSNFRVGDEASNYILTVSGYSGTAGDALDWHSGMEFSTQDRDNDRYPGNCAVYLSAAFWFNSCYNANLNGLFGKKGDTGQPYILWHYWREFNALAFSEMKLR